MKKTWKLSLPFLLHTLIVLPPAVARNIVKLDPEETAEFLKNPYREYQIPYPECAYMSHPGWNCGEAGHHLESQTIKCYDSWPHNTKNYNEVEPYHDYQEDYLHLLGAHLNFMIPSYEFQDPDVSFSRAFRSWSTNPCARSIGKMTCAEMTDTRVSLTCRPKR
jgi:hypothetical protein